MTTCHHHLPWCPDPLCMLFSICVSRRGQEGNSTSVTSQDRKRDQWLITLIIANSFINLPFRVIWCLYHTYYYFRETELKELIDNKLILAGVNSFQLGVGFSVLIFKLKSQLLTYIQLLQKNNRKVSQPPYNLRLWL